MAEMNGWGKWLAGIIATMILTALSVLGTNVIANDRASQDRDDKLAERCTQIQLEQQKVNQEILVSLAKIDTDVNYIKKAVIPKNR